MVLPLIVAGSAAALASGGMNMLGTAQNAHYQRDMIRMQQDFAKWQMMNAHQIEIADLKKAGINPILTAGGSGASANAGGAPSVPQSNLGDTMMNAFKAGTSLAPEVENTISDTEVKQAQADNINADTQVKATQVDLNEAEKEKKKAEILKINNELPQIQANITKLQAEGKTAEAEAKIIEYKEKYKKALFWSEVVGINANSASQVINAVKGTGIMPNKSNNTSTNQTFIYKD